MSETVDNNQLELEKEKEVLNKVANLVLKWGMAIPAIMFLEMTKNLNFIGSQFMVFMGPLVQTFFSLNEYDTLAQALEKRENVENLIVLIEEKEDKKRRQSEEER